MNRGHWRLLSGATSLGVRIRHRLSATLTIWGPSNKEEFLGSRVLGKNGEARGQQGKSPLLIEGYRRFEEVAGLSFWCSILIHARD
jgi:hypothetical protein